MTAGATRRRIRILLLVIAVLAVGACSKIVATLTATYDGPPPEKKDIVDERVIVRWIYLDDRDRAVSGFRADRVHFILNPA